MKITNEHDFDGIKPHITKIIKEVIDPLEKGIKSKQKKLDEKLYYLNDIMSSMNKQGLDIFDNQSVKQPSDDREGIA